LRQSWLHSWALITCPQVILDTKPFPVVGYTRSKCRSDFAGNAIYGYCASHKLAYFSYKLVMLSTLDSILVAYDLVPAHTDERAAADTILNLVSNADIWKDKGFLGSMATIGSGHNRQSYLDRQTPESTTQSRCL